MENKSVFGLNENAAAALSYVLGPFSGIFMLVMERGNKFVRFHALQSTLWFLMLWVAWWVLGLLPRIWIIGPLLGIFVSPILFFGGLLYFVSKAWLAYRAYQGATTKIPIIGDVVWNQINRV